MSSPLDLNQIMQQAQQLGDKLKRAQEELRHRKVSVSVGGGMVEVEMNGRMELVSIRIDPQAVDPRDVEMLQDLIVAAINQARTRAEALAQEEMKKISGLPIDGLMGMLGGQG